MENLFKDAGVDINDKSTYDNWWFKYGFDDINPIPKAERLDLVGKDLTITEIDNKHNIVIKTEKLKVDSIKNGAGGLYIDFKEGVIGEKGKEAIGFSEVDYVLSHSSSFPSNLRAHSNITIYTEKGHIDGDINTKGSGSRGIEVWVTGEGVISGDAYVMSSEMIPAFNWEGDLLESSSGSLHISLANGAKMLGDVLVENEYGYGVLVLQAGLIKSQMQGDINLKQGSMMLAMGDNTEISGEINIEKDGIMTIKDIAGFHKGKGVISNKITNEGFLNFDINSQLSSNDIIIENGIDNDGGIVNITSYNNDESYLGFLKKDGYHFKNINGGKIAIDGWDFREKEGNGRIIIDTDGQDKREENLKNVKFGEFNEFPDHPNYPNFVRPKEEETITEMSGAQSIKTDTKTTPITITLFGDREIFAKGSYVQYLVLTPEEEKKLKDEQISIYDKDGRHNVAGHFIEGGTSLDPDGKESNFATLLHEGKLKLSDGSGGILKPFRVQADGKICYGNDCERDKNNNNGPSSDDIVDNIPGSTIGSNQINALNTNMTQTFNTLKEISTKTFRTEHTNLLSSNTLKEQVAYALYNHSKNVSKNNSLDNNPINKNLSSNNLKNHTNNNLLSYNAKNNSLNDNINLLDDTGDLSNTNIASNVSNINALTNPASNTSENNTLSNASNNTNLEAYITDEQITTYATYAQAGASDALFYDEINKGYTDLDLLRALDDIFIKQNKKESDLYTYAVPYYNYIKDKSLGLGTTKTNSYGLLAGGQLNSNYGVYGFYINLENSKRENNTTSTDTDSTSYLAGLTYYNAFHRFSNKELYVSLNTMLGTTKSDVSMIDSDSYKDDFDFDSLNYGAELRAGVNIYNVLTNSYWTPELGLIYTGMAVDSYEIKHTKLTEYYDKTTINLLEGVAGLRFHHAYNQTTRFNAALGAKFRLYDDAKSQMKIAGETLANPLFATRDIKLPDTSYYVQFGLVKLLGDNVELSLNYQGNFAKDIQGHTAFARIGYWW
ncbi:autotransporter outer membrane beta-barrel domain-containing protein [Helicobacter winghamensis]|uniref:autotransporter outer membrane beta-barrel domain-containing protein n=1 Tax=Helicobacter winghamensis TaxID=157268 RepID=UPI0018A414EA|nr:autotransporter outer membrane beta-barrel domain-containing protein [Helicobacter winghamensis]QOQ98460.1 hypothetical protein A0Z60_02490 [Helicobacter winghamensis]